MALNHEMGVQFLPLVPISNPTSSNGKAAVCRTAMTGFDSRDRVHCWSSSEVERHAENVRVRRLKTVLQRHSRVAQRLEQLVYTQKIAGSSPCLGNHTLVAEQVGNRLLPGTIGVRLLARVPIRGWPSSV